MRPLPYLATFLVWRIKSTTACPPPWWDYDVVNNTDSTLDKRFYITQQFGSRIYWQPVNAPVVNYCFFSGMTDDNKRLVGGWLEGGWALWKAAGGNQISHLTFQQGSAAICADSNAVTLTIKTNLANNIMTLPVSGGYVDVDPKAVQEHPLPENAVLAHEIGHVWGLLHEHQRPDVFAPPVGTNSGNARLVFDCQALADWEKFGSPGYNDPLCTDRNAAYSAGFKALHFLPLVKSALTPLPYGGDVDYDSIMNYGGQYLSKLSNVPGRSEGGRTIVVYDRTTSNGGTGTGTGPYVPRRVPSAGDVAALRRIYPPSGATGGGSCAAGSKQKRDGVCAGNDYITEIADCYVAAVATNTVVK